MAENSELNFIGISAFKQTKITKFTIPENLNNKNNENFSAGIPSLKSIEISPFNKHYACLDNTILLYKENEESLEYDSLIYVKQNEQSIVIPSYIKVIGSLSFFKSSLKNCIFEENSQCEIISENAFYCSLIERILVPDNVKRIEASSFSHCPNLQTIEFTASSKLSIIGSNSFQYSHINEIIIPSKVQIIGENAFLSCKQLKSIEFAEKSELVSIKSYAFQHSAIKQIVIPSKVQQICSCAFIHCENLESIEFSNNSDCRIIEANAFQSTKIKTIKSQTVLK